MSDVDPFAGIAGGLDGFDYDGPSVAEEHVLTDEEVAARVQEGSLGGEEAALDAEFDAAVAADPVEFQLGNDEPDPTLASTPTVEEPATNPSSAPAESSDESSASAPDAEPAAPKRTRRRKTAEEKEAAAAAAEESRHNGGLYLIIGEGTLEGGAPYWYVAEEIEASSRPAALRKHYTNAGTPEDGVSVRCILDREWQPVQLKYAVHTIQRTVKRLEIT